MDLIYTCPKRSFDITSYLVLLPPTLSHVQSFLKSQRPFDNYELIKQQMVP